MWFLSFAGLWDMSSAAEAARQRSGKKNLHSKQNGGGVHSLFAEELVVFPGTMVTCETGGSTP